MYTVNFSGTIAAGACIVAGGSDGVVLPDMEALNLAFEGTVQDANFSMKLRENTDLGTGGSSITPQPKGHSRAAACTWKNGSFSGEPTLTGQPLIYLGTFHRQPRRLTWIPQSRSSPKPQTAAANRGMALVPTSVPASATLVGSIEYHE